MEITNERIKAHLADSSRKLADLTCNLVYENPALLDALIRISFEESEPWSQRASRVISLCAGAYPEIVENHVPRIIANLKTIPTEGARRNFLKILVDLPVKVKAREKSLLLNLCFDYLLGEYSIATKVYSMDLAYKLSHDLPEIAFELSVVIEDLMENGSAGMKSHGQKLVKKIKRDLL